MNNCTVTFVNYSASDEYEAHLLEKLRQRLRYESRQQQQQQQQREGEMHNGYYVSVMR